MYEEQQKELEALRVWPMWRGNLWHSTSPKGARAILAEGLIRFDLPGLGYESSFCRVRNAVSLFDFSGTLEDIASQSHNWMGWCGHQTQIRDKASVWLRLDRAVLGDAVKSQQETRAEFWEQDSGKGQMIPYVEVCHRGPVPASAITGALVIAPLNYDQFELIEPGEGFGDRIDAYANSLPELPPLSDLMRAVIEANEDRRKT